jgi:hypothetical protein
MLSMLTTERWYVATFVRRVSLDQTLSQDWHVDVFGWTLWSDDASEDHQQRPISHFVRDGALSNNAQRN